MPALMVACVLVLLMGALVLAVTADPTFKDCLGGPVLGIVGALVLVLGVGLGEWLGRRR